MGVIVVLDWVAMAEIVPQLQRETNYTNCYFIRYFVGSLFSLMLIPWILMNGCKCNAKVDLPMIASSFAVKALYFIGTYIWYLSLNATIAAINNTIYMSSVAVAYVFSVILLPNYKMSWTKNMGVCVCVLGVVVVGLGTLNESDDKQENTWYGLVEAVISMVGWGLTEVLLSMVGSKYYSNIGGGSDTGLNRVNSKVFMQGFCGLICFCSFWIGIPILHFCGIEPFALPQSREEWLVLVVPACMDIVFVCALVIGISLTNPVFIAVSQLLVIPLGFVYAALFDGLVVSQMAILGSICIFIGFLIMELPVQKYIDVLLEWRMDRRTKMLMAEAYHEADPPSV